MKFEDENKKRQIFNEFIDFVKNTQSSENLNKGFEYEKVVDNFKSLTFETWKQYLNNYDKEEARFAYLKLSITHEGKSLNDIKSKLENNESYEILVNLFGYYPILGNSNIYCLNLAHYREIFLRIINQHTHIGGVILDFIDNFFEYNNFHVNSHLKENLEKKYLTDLKYYVNDLIYRENELKENNRWIPKRSHKRLKYLSYNLEEKYTPNTIIHDDRQVRARELIGKMDHGYRFLIISSHIHQVFSLFGFDVYRAWTGHFKVLDVFKYNECYQITLLHLPEDLWMLFENDEFEIDLVDNARKCFIDSFDKEYCYPLYDPVWYNNSFPIGINEDGDFIEAFYTNHTSDGRKTAESEMDLKTRMQITRQMLNYNSPELKQGKYPAPNWLVYPEIPRGSMGWRMGYGEAYSMNSFIFKYHNKTFEELFPKPLNWSKKYRKEFGNYINHKISPAPAAWNPTGTPKYNFDNIKDKLSKENIILVDDYFGDNLLHGKFQIGVNKFESFYDNVGEREHLEMEVWDNIKYTVYLNTLYYRIMENDSLRNRLLESGDKIIIFENLDEYFGTRIENEGFIGQNQVGFALMEIRDELRRIYKNNESIDWFLTEYLKHSKYNFKKGDIIK